MITTHQFTKNNLDINMTAEKQIEEILMEAYAYGIREYVISEASRLLELNKWMDKVTAYEAAFNFTLNDIPKK